MEKFIEILKDISAFVLPFVLTIGGIFYAYGKMREGKIDGKKGTLELLSEEIEQLRKLVESKDKEQKENSEINRKRNEDLGREISGLQATVTEKDKKLREYVEIFQGRDPQLLILLKDIHMFMERIDKKLS